MLTFRRRLVPSAGPLLALLVAVGQPEHLAAQAIRGSIRTTTTGRAVASARVTMLDASGDTIVTVLSGPDGNFLIDAPQWGEFIIYIRRLGYRPLVQAPVELHTAQTLRITYRLQPLPVSLDPVIVEADAVVQYAYVRYLQKEGFYRRQRCTNGNLLDPDAIEKHRKFAHRVADYFVSLPRARMVVRRSGFGRELWLGCGRPRVFIDDTPLLFFDGRIDDAVQAPDVLAIEVYDGAALSDAYYGTCAVVIWTRFKAEAQMHRE